MTVSTGVSAIRRLVRWMPTSTAVQRFRRTFLFVVIAFLLPTPYAQAQTETVEYYGLDALGSVRVVFGANGGILGRMDYGPFGESLSAGTAIPKRAYAGLFRDGEAGLDYAEARSLQNRVGRFSTTDVAYEGLFNPQQWNRYTYATNNPLGFIDPSGSTQVAVSCGAGPQWCPGNIQIGDHEFINVNGQFNPEFYGYHGGETAAAEAAWGAALDAAFVAQAVFSKVIDALTPKDRLSGIVETSINGKKVRMDQCTVDSGCMKMGMVIPPWAIGRLGESYVRATLAKIGVELGKKLPLIMGGLTRIPDGRVGNTLYEIKNVAMLNWTPQLEAYAQWAKDNNGMLNIYVRVSTDVAKAAAQKISQMPHVQVIPYMPW